MPEILPDPTTSTEAVSFIELHHDHGVLYVYGRDRKPLLKITGLPRPIPRLQDCSELAIEIRQEGAVCNWGPTPTVITPGNPIPHPIEDDPWRDKRDDVEDIVVRAAGVTLLPGARK